VTDIRYIRQTGPDPLLQVDTTWDDLRFPVFGRYIDIIAGHLDYDAVELGVAFDDSSRYNDADQVAIIAQMTHRWKSGTALQPHVHWMQSAAAVPNMLLKYRTYSNGDTPSAWTLAATTGQAFTYTAGSILQVSSWPEIDTTGLGISAFIDIKIYRDTANTSTEFAGADPLTGDWLMKDFDLHFEIDQPSGSSEQWLKVTP